VSLSKSRKNLHPLQMGNIVVRTSYNFQAQVFYDIELIKTVEDVQQTTYTYFAHSPKRVNKFCTSNGNKMPKITVKFENTFH